MKSQITTWGKTAEAWGNGVFHSVTVTRGKYQINAEGKEYTAADLRAIGTCIDRLLPRGQR